MSQLITLKGEELCRAVCSAFEPSLPVISARKARKNTKGFAWVSCHGYRSPDGWWMAEIGTDHGPETTDDDPVAWRPDLEVIETIDGAWSVVDEMKVRGWLVHILSMVDGWVVNAKRYRLVNGAWDGNAVAMSDLVQEIGDTAEEAICRAAVAAMRITETHP